MTYIFSISISDHNNFDNAYEVLSGFRISRMQCTNDPFLLSNSINSIVVELGKEGFPRVMCLDYYLGFDSFKNFLVLNIQMYP